eukprot:5663504-Alexandrium_andersonii.AAC.1
MSTKETRKRYFAEYHRQCPVVPGQKRSRFNVMGYEEKCVAAEHVLKDRVGEMMNEACFVAWMSKPENGGLSALEASAEFSKRRKCKDSIFDEDGGEKYPGRVWVKTKDQVVFRDSWTKSKEL